MKQALSGKVIIVTGGGRGLGRAMTLGLARAGATVIATASQDSVGVKAVADMAREELGRDCVIAAIADVTREADCERVVKDTIGRLSKIDALINNAARGMRLISETYMTEPARFWEIGPDLWRLVIDTNVNGPFLMARASAPHMLKSGWGRIICGLNEAARRQEEWTGAEEAPV